MESLQGCGMLFFAVHGAWGGLIGALAIAALGWPTGAAARAFCAVIAVAAQQTLAQADDERLGDVRTSGPLGDTK
jgi:hypothetical protein